MMDADQRKHLRIAKQRRGSIARAAQRTTNNERVNAAKRIMAGVEADALRRTDPFERAKGFLQRRGYAVFDRRVVYGVPHRGIQVGRRVLDDRDAVIVFAVGLGFVA